MLRFPMGEMELGKAGLHFPGDRDYPALLGVSSIPFFHPIPCLAAGWFIQILRLGEKSVCLISHRVQPWGREAL